jgi:hypothetical protein
MGATSFMLAYQSQGSDRTWDTENAAPSDIAIEYENVGEGLNLQELSSLYHEPSSLTIELKSCALSTRVENAVLEGISHSVRGDFLPAAPFVTIGFHDIYDDVEHEPGLLYGRAFLSVRFFGYSTPAEWELFREQVFALPEIRRVRAELESVTGPLEECVYWSV